MTFIIYSALNITQYYQDYQDFNFSLFFNQAQNDEDEGQSYTFTMHDYKNDEYTNKKYTTDDFQIRYAHTIRQQLVTIKAKKEEHKDLFYLDFYSDINKNNFVHIRITDEGDSYNYLYPIKDKNGNLMLCTERLLEYLKNQENVNDEILKQIKRFIVEVEPGSWDSFKESINNLKKKERYVHFSQNIDRHERNLVYGEANELTNKFEKKFSILIISLMAAGIVMGLIYAFMLKSVTYDYELKKIDTIFAILLICLILLFFSIFGYMMIQHNKDLEKAKIKQNEQKASLNKKKYEINMNPYIKYS